MTQESWHKQVDAVGRTVLLVETPNAGQVRVDVGFTTDEETINVAFSLTPHQCRVFISVLSEALGKVETP